jgi:hypothetical protein
MRIFINADRKSSRTEPPENQNRADSAVATIWLVFYILALGVAIASPIVLDTLTVAAR